MSVLLFLWFFWLLSHGSKVVPKANVGPRLSCDSWWGMIGSFPEHLECWIFFKSPLCSKFKFRKLKYLVKYLVRLGFEHWLSGARVFTLDITLNCFLREPFSCLERPWDQPACSPSLLWPQTIISTQSLSLPIGHTSGQGPLQPAHNLFQGF